MKMVKPMSEYEIEYGSHSRGPHHTDKGYNIVKGGIQQQVSYMG